MKNLREYMEYRRVRREVKEALSEDNRNFW